jgi:pimeloyl-ACP methyl ester carboxylesterase
MPGGRLLGYAEYGDPAGAPIIYLHGLIGSRLDWKYFVGPGQSPRRAARVIAIDRPGIGFSQYQARRRLLDWPDDVVALADELHLDRFAVLGVSGGGPYAAACAYKIPQRLTRVGIVAGMGPSNAPGAQDGASWTLPGRSVLVRRVLANLTARTLRNRPERFLGQIAARISEADQSFLGRSENGDLFLASSRESFRTGARGVARDAALYVQPWGFELKNIGIDVQLWHGDDDRVVLPSVGRFVADSIGNCKATFWPGEGHLSWVDQHLDDVVSALTP